MRRLVIITVLVLGLGLATIRLWQSRDGVSQAQEGLLSASQPLAELLLPDMIVVRPWEMFLRKSSTGRALRFSTTFINQGTGPLELIGHTDQDLNVTYAAQYVKQNNGPGIYRDIGAFVYHPAHSHWHIGNYVQYQLWSVLPNGERDQVLLKSDKQSFCVWDENSQDLTLKGAPRARVFPRTCNQKTQGMSIGWSDTYRANVEGQEMFLADLPDGTYLFRSVVNPDRKLLEANYDNDESVVYLEIKGEKLSMRDSY